MEMGRTALRRKRAGTYGFSEMPPGITSHISHVKAFLLRCYPLPYGRGSETHLPSPDRKGVGSIAKIRLYGLPLLSP